MDTSSNDVSNKEILQHLQIIETRISKIEDYLDLHPITTEEEIEEAEFLKKKKSESDEELEFRIGQFWFAKLGIFAFLVGWLIANTLPFETMHPFIPVIIGLAAGLITIVSAISLKNKFPHLSGWVLGSGFAIVFIAVLRMHYFSPSPLISQIVPVLIMAYIVSLALILTGINWKSPYITAFGYSVVYLSALLSD
jgi:DNA-binding transcriptional MerR regulator